MNKAERDLVEAAMAAVAQWDQDDLNTFSGLYAQLRAIIAEARREGAMAELKQLGKWVRDATGYNRDDAIDEIARAIENRIRTLGGYGG